jgi:hypothetical protein
MQTASIVRQLVKGVILTSSSLFFWSLNTLFGSLARAHDSKNGAVNDDVSNNIGVELSVSNSFSLNLEEDRVGLDLRNSNIAEFNQQFIAVSQERQQSLSLSNRNKTSA